VRAVGSDESGGALGLGVLTSLLTTPGARPVARGAGPVPGPAVVPAHGWTPSGEVRSHRFADRPSSRRPALPHPSARRRSLRAHAAGPAAPTAEVAA